MLLAIDSGNTNAVFGIFNGQNFVKAFRCINDPKRTADEYIVWLSDLMQINNLDYRDIEDAVVGSVVPETQFNLVNMCNRYFKKEPLVIGDPDTKPGIDILIPQPEQLGADRLVNAVAAHRTYGGPLICIDFGTATNFDVINEEGNYIGGVIAPGITLSVDALYRAAAKLPMIQIEAPLNIIGQSTVSAMQSGIFWGYISMIEGMVSRIQREYGVPMKVIATGGLAELFAKKTGSIEQCDRSLTLRGLVDVYRRNRKG